MAKKPANQTPSMNAGRRAAEHFARAIERVTSRDEAWRFVLSGPRGSEPGADAYVRLAYFLKHDAPPERATPDECQTYLALVRRFLSAGAMDAREGTRLIALLNEAARPRAKR